MDRNLIIATLAVIATVVVGILTWLVSIRQSPEKPSTSDLFSKLWNLIKRNPRQITLGLIGILVVVVILRALKMPVVQGFLSTKVEVTVEAIIVIALPILVLAITWIYSYRKRRLEISKREQERKAEIAKHNQRIAELEEQLTKQKKSIEQFSGNEKANSKIINNLTIEANELRDELRKQEALVSARNYLFTNYGLNIDSAKFGIHPGAASTEDVTEQIILGLKEQGNIPLSLNLVGGKENDPEEGKPKKTFVVGTCCVQGQGFNLEFDENHILSITDLIQNSGISEFLPSQPRVNTDLQLSDVFKLDKKEFIEDSTPQRLIIHLINRGNDIIRIKEVRLSLYVHNGLTDLDVSSEYRVGKKGRLIIPPVDQDKVEMLPGRKYPVVINLAKRWNSKDITQLFGNLANLYIDLVYKDELIEDEFVSF